MGCEPATTWSTCSRPPGSLEVIRLYGWTWKPEFLADRCTVLTARDGFVEASRAALTKLGVEWESTEAERAYNEGRSTQVPANAVVRIKGRCARRLGYGGNSLVVERRT